MSPSILEQLLIDVELLAKYENREFGNVPLENNCDLDIPQFTALFEQHPRLIHYADDGATISAENHVIIRRWAQTKTVYRFRRDLLRALSETEETEMHTELLRRLPYPAFFLDFDSDFSVWASDSTDSLGTFVLIEPYADGAVTIGLVDVFGYMAEQHSYLNNSTMFTISDGERISEAVARAFSDAGEKISESRLGLMIERVKTTLQCAYYLAAQNADIQPVKTTKKNRLRRDDGKRLNLRKWDVGFRLGYPYLKRNDGFHIVSSSDSGDVERNRPRPHVRRAHWHHYWCGEGRARLEVRWISPTFVAAGDIVATGHSVL